MTRFVGGVHPRFDLHRDLHQLSKGAKEPTSADAGRALAADTLSLRYQAARSTTKRLTISVDDHLADAFDALVRTRGYDNRSEAFRDLLRHDIGQLRMRAEPTGPCVATLSYLYNHHQRQLAMRLTDLQHAHHELTVATTHAHLDHDHCIETVILKGPSDQVRAFAQAVMAEPGVSHGQLHVVPMSVHRAHGHDHLHPSTSPLPANRSRQRR